MENAAVLINGNESNNVFSKLRKPTPKFQYANVLKTDFIKVNDKNEMDGLALLKNIYQGVVSGCFFDPQYRGIMDKMNYGNEGKTRQVERSELNQMSDETIISFVNEIDRVLVPSGHLFLWIDKFHLCEGTNHWFNYTKLSVVDLITWDKGKIGMGYRTRRKSEYLLILQKEPKRAKGVWTNHSIPDTWTEKITDKIHTHQKPIGLQTALIEAISAKGDYIIDPCAGSYSVLDACKLIERNFIGCDLKTI
ncbi:MAG: site-specific DNA-methyltransferase [Bacteroidetes bacterium]|nr:site-specific DNA-methyltransferase [Bacteroidota bacterium]